MSNLFDRLFNRDDIQKSCDNCLYNKEGECMTLFSQDCKDNGLILWYEADEKEEER